MNKPHEISPSEWAEIMHVEAVREDWGLEPDETPEEFSSMVYGVKFDYTSRSPAYVGDLYVLLGDALERPLVLVRHEEVLMCTEDEDHED